MGVAGDAGGRAGRRLDWRHPAVLLSVAALTLAGYGRTLTRYFVSEDFVILRLLIEGSFWSTLWAELTGPWLGITLVQFYRPLSTLILKLEAMVWGTWAPGYLAGHFAVHLLNVALLYRLARHLDDDREPALPFTAALLFSLYPLHPNTVVFIGSFATLFATTACLVSMLLFLSSRRSAGGRRLAGSMACFALALGCYEGAAVLPGLLLVLDLLFGSDRRPFAWRGLFARFLPYLGILAGYLALRQAVLGSAIGGYHGFRARLAGFELQDLFARFQLNWARIVYPAYEPGPARWAQVAVAVAVAAGTLWALARLRSGRTAPRLWLLAVAWVFVSQMPFDVVDVVPANGRYWYFAAGGLALLIAAAVSAVVPERRRALALAAVSILLGGSYFGLLIRYGRLHTEAAATAEAIQEGLLRAAAGTEAPVFVAGHPDFVHVAEGPPAAQVFHWGLSDALMPPFVDREVRVYPLPRFSPAELGPILSRPDLGEAWSWDGSSSTYRRLAAGASAPARRIATRATFRQGELEIRFEPTGAARYRLILLARGHPSFRVIQAEPGADGWVEVPVPIDFLASMERLYQDEVFWWIEAENRAGKPTAFSEIRVLRRGSMLR